MSSIKTSMPYPPDQIAAAIINHETDEAPGAWRRFQRSAVITRAITAPRNVADATNDEVSNTAM